MNHQSQHGRVLPIAVILAGLLLSACASLVRPNFSTELKTLRAGQYKLDPLHSFLIFRIGHLELSKIVGRFNNLDASLDFDPENPAELQLSGLIATDSIDLNNPDLEETLQEESWFNSVQFPQISFQSTGRNTGRNTGKSTGTNTGTNTKIIAGTDAGTTLEIEGILSIRGIEQPITLQATFNGGADNILTRKYTIGFSAQTQFSRSDFGMDTFTAFVGDTIEVELHGEFQRQ